MKKKWSLVIVGLVAVSLCAATVYGQHRFGMGWKGRKGMMGDGPGMMGDGPGMMLPLLLRGANLTPEQKTQVHHIMDTHRATFQTLFGQLRTAQGEVTNKLLLLGRSRQKTSRPKSSRSPNCGGNFCRRDSRPP